MEYRKVFCGVIRACLVVGRMGMNRIRLWGFLLGAALVQVMPMYGAMPDKTLLRIGGREVSSAEFESYYRQYADSATETPQRYLQRFVLFKLKVADARRQGWDTLPDFRQACRVLQAQVLKRILVDPDKKRRSCVNVISVNRHGYSCVSGYVWKESVFCFLSVRPGNGCVRQKTGWKSLAGMYGKA